MGHIIKNAVSICLLIGLFCGLAALSLDALDRSIYPGCKVIDQQEDILVIELDERMADDITDSGCQVFGELVYKIAQDGYQVQVVNGHFASLGIITREKARILAEGY